MILKPVYYLLFSFLFLSGCSSINNSSMTKTNDERIETDYLRDIEAEGLAASAIVDPILKSTQKILQSESANAQTHSLRKPDDFKAEQRQKYNNVWLRLPELYQFSNINNKRIQDQEKWFINHKNHLQEVSRRASPFLYFITEEINKRNMPGEIALLPIIESSFNTHAYSPMKASGLWQFVPSTGRYFGLKQNGWYDGRRDVYHSTLAALTYLQQLNKYYKGDWLLALAAYNAGASNINKAIKKNREQGKAIDYWSLSLPKETNKYIPKLIALSKIIKNHLAHGISLVPIDNSPHLKRVNTQSQIALSVVAKMAGISIDEVQTYNPAFKQWATAPDGPHFLFIPIDKAGLFEQQLALLDDKDRIHWLQHKIRSGESLSVIARQYKISVAVLKTANHLKNSRIQAGKYLMVPSEDKNLATYQVQPKEKSQQKTKIIQTYKVRKGDSFWTIARRFNMSHQKLASLNGLSADDILSIGQKLKVFSIRSNQAI